MRNPLEDPGAVAHDDDDDDVCAGDVASLKAQAWDLRLDLAHGAAQIVDHQLTWIWDRSEHAIDPVTIAARADRIYELAEELAAIAGPGVIVHPAIVSAYHVLKRVRLVPTVAWIPRDDANLVIAHELALSAQLVRELLQGYMLSEAIHAKSWTVERLDRDSTENVLADMEHCSGPFAGHYGCGDSANPARYPVPDDLVEAFDIIEHPLPFKPASYMAAARTLRAIAETTGYYDPCAT